MRHAIVTGRNPFARFTVRRRKIRVTWNSATNTTGKTCDWCGSVKSDRASKRYLWQYYVDADSARESGNIKGLFCRIECCNAYNG